jgi:hypothetical protein
MEPMVVMAARAAQLVGQELLKRIKIIISSFTSRRKRN